MEAFQGASQEALHEALHEASNEASNEIKPSSNFKTKTYTYTKNGKTRTITRTFEVNPKRYTREQIDNYINDNRDHIKSVPIRVAYEEFKDSTKINMSFSWFYNNVRNRA